MNQDTSYYALIHGERASSPSVDSFYSHIARIIDYELNVVRNSVCFYQLTKRMCIDNEYRISQCGTMKECVCFFFFFLLFMNRLLNDTDTE